MISIRKREKDAHTWLQPGLLIEAGSNSITGHLLTYLLKRQWSKASHPLMSQITPYLFLGFNIHLLLYFRAYILNIGNENKKNEKFLFKFLANHLNKKCNVMESDLETYTKICKRL